MNKTRYRRWEQRHSKQNYWMSVFDFIVYSLAYLKIVVWYLVSRRYHPSFRKPVLVSLSSWERKLWRHSSVKKCGTRESSRVFDWSIPHNVDFPLQLESGDGAAYTENSAIYRYPLSSRMQASSHSNTRFVLPAGTDAKEILVDLWPLFKLSENFWKFSKVVIRRW